MSGYFPETYWKYWGYYQALEPDLLGAWYKAENNADDEIGSNNAAAGIGTAYTPGVDGQAFLFNSNSNSAVTVPNMAIPPPYTIEFYFRAAPTAIGGHVLFGSAWNDASLGVLRFSGYANAPPASNGLDWLHNGSSRWNTGNCIVRGEIYKLVLVVDSPMALYINNAPILLANYTSYTPPTLGQFTLGWATAFAAANGAFIDEVKIYTAAVHPTLMDNVVYEFDGSSTTDASGNGWTVVNGADPLFGDGRDGSPNGAFAFAGSVNNKRFLPNGPRMTGDWTYEFSVFPATGALGGYVFQEQGAQITAQWISASGGYIYVDRNGVNMNVFSAGGSVPTNTWSDIKITYDGSNYRLYVNGALAATSAAFADNFYLAGTNSIGNQSSGNYFSGRVGNIKFTHAVV